MTMVDWIGSFAGFCTTVSFIPQVYRVWKTRSVQDISLSMYLIFFTGVFFWIIYGIFKDAYPLIVCNLITLIFVFLVLWMKLRWEPPKSDEEKENNTAH